MNTEVQNREVQNKEVQNKEAKNKEEHVYKPAWRSFCLHIAAMIACFVLVVFVSLKVPMDAAYQKALWGFFLLFVLVAFGDMFFKRLGATLIIRFDEVAFEKGILKQNSLSSRGVDRGDRAHRERKIDAGPAPERPLQGAGGTDTHRRGVPSSGG